MGEDVKKIEVLVDNNALEKLSAHHDYDQIQLCLNELYGQGKLRIFFSFRTFQEQLAGINSEYILKEKAQRWVKQAAIICKKFLLVPDTIHVRRSARSISENEYVTCWTNGQNMLRDFCECPNLIAYNKAFRVLANDFISAKDEWYKTSQKIFAYGKHKTKYNRQNGVNMVFASSEEDLQEFRNMIFNNLITRFDLNTNASLYRKPLDFVKAVPSLSILTDILTFYYERVYLEKQKIKQGDYVDIFQSVFLDACDYILTEDKNYRDLINKCPYSNYSGRAMSLEEFIEAVFNATFPLIKRAPCNFDTLKVSFK